VFLMFLQLSYIFVAIHDYQYFSKLIQFVSIAVLAHLPFYFYFCL